MTNRGIFLFAIDFFATRHDTRVFHAEPLGNKCRKAVSLSLSRFFLPEPSPINPRHGVNGLNEAAVDNKAVVGTYRR